VHIIHVVLWVVAVSNADFYMCVYIHERSHTYYIVYIYMYPKMCTQNTFVQIVNAILYMYVATYRIGYPIYIVFYVLHVYPVYMYVQVHTIYMYNFFI
jgi:hypothetical protein